MIGSTLLQQEQLLKEGEFDLLKVRKHWIVYVEDFLLHGFGCLVFAGGAMFLASRGSFGLIEKDSAFIAMMLIGFVLVFWTSFFYAWTKNYFDMWHVTNTEIIAINQKDMLVREELFMKLNRIQDASFEQNGLIATFFGYGTLKVQSAGTAQEFILEYARDVEAVAEWIREVRDNAQK